MNKMLREMSGQELAEVLKEMADRVSETVASNQSVIERLREEAMKLEAQRRDSNPNA